jgi:hypothetical protein
MPFAKGGLIKPAAGPEADFQALINCEIGFPELLCATGVSFW